MLQQATEMPHKGLRKDVLHIVPVEIPITMCMFPTFLPIDSVIWLQFSLKQLHSTPLLSNSLF